MECEESGCADAAVVELHIPRDANRRVCPSHARSRAQRDGVVAEPLEGHEDAWP